MESPAKQPSIDTSSNEFEVHVSAWVKNLRLAQKKKAGFLDWPTWPVHVWAIRMEGAREGSSQAFAFAAGSFFTCQTAEAIVGQSHPPTQHPLNGLNYEEIPDQTMVSPGCLIL